MSISTSRAPAFSSSPTASRTIAASSGPVCSKKNRSATPIVRPRTRVAGRCAGEHLQRGRGIPHRPRHRPAVVERRAQRLDAGKADASEGGLQPDDAAHGRRAADRAAGIGSRRERDDARGDGRARPTARPARHPAGVVRVAARAVPGVVRGRAPGQLVRAQLPDANGARAREQRDHFGVSVGDVVSIDGTAVGGAGAAGVDQVLPPDRHAGQRAGIIAARDRIVDRTRLAQRPLLGHQPDGAELVVRRAAEMRARDLDRRDVA